MFKVLLIFFVGLLSIERSRGINLCPDVPGCNCRKLTSSWKASCRGKDPSLQLLPLHNVTELEITRANLTNVSSLHILFQFKAMTRLKIRKTAIPEFNWNWLPDSCSRITISYSRPYKRYGKPTPLPPFKYPAWNQSCELRPSINVTFLYADKLPYTQLPQCLPDSLRTIYFQSAPFTKVQDYSTNRTTQQVIHWPNKARFFSTKYSNFSRIGENFFQNAPASLNKISISRCKVPLIRLPSAWPPKGQVQSLFIQLCGINETKPSDFAKLQNLLLLNLHGNQLKTVPAGLPKNINRLFLTKNLIEHVSSSVWDGLHNLSFVDISENNLHSVPKNLPKNLRKLYLRNNAIEFSDRTAFRQLKKLERVDLSHNKLLNMPESLPTTMKSLSVTYNDIARIRSPESYQYCVNCSMRLANNPWVCDENMVQMLLWANQHSVKMELYDQCGGPITEDLGKVGINEITKYIKFIKNSEEFNKCSYKINELECINASLSSVPPEAPSVLKKISLTHNDNLTAIPDGHYQQQTELKVLDLEYNSLNEFPKGLPSSLERLFLGDNNITSISSDAQPTLNKLTNLIELHLANNQIKMLYDYQLLSLKSLHWLGLHGNPLHCDCSIFSLTLWYLNNKHIDFFNPAEQLFLPVCRSPAKREGQKITQLSGAFRYELLCTPTLCSWEHRHGTLNCSAPVQFQLQNTTFIPQLADLNVQPRIPESSYWENLDLSYLHLTQQDIMLTQLSRLITLNLTGNALTKIPVMSLPQSLETLIATKNKITAIPPYIQHHLTNLKFLNLQDNQIKTISSLGLRALPLIERVHLYGNPFKCDCELRGLVSYIQTQKENEVVLENNQFQELTCEEPPNFKGKKLFNLQEENYCTVNVWTEITGGAVGGFAFLLTMAIIVIGILYKRRKLQERKDIVQGFRKLLEQEALMNDEETGKTEHGDPVKYEYDAFVSYCSNIDDEDFVYKMVEVLEEEKGRKLCIHERDFVPGQGIADNIVKCIGLSRRVIIVVSRKYAASAWCQYEVQVTLAHLHKYRRGRLLVPVLLEDVTKDNEYAGSVKTILSLITGIHVPSPAQSYRHWNMFWNKLDSTLPDKDNLVTTSVSYQVD